MQSGCSSGSRMPAERKTAGLPRPEAETVEYLLVSHTSLSAFPDKPAAAFQEKEPAVTEKNRTNINIT